MLKKLAPLLIAVAVIGGAVVLSRSGLAKALGPDVPGDGGEPARKGNHDVRDGWRPGLIEVKRPARFCVLGCGELGFLDRPEGGVYTNAPGSTWWAPGQLGLVPRAGFVDASSCRPPPGESGVGARRSWWAPWNRAYRVRGQAGPGVTDAEFLSSSADLRGTDETAEVMAVTIGGAVYTRSDSTRNFASLGVQGGTLWVSTVGYLAVDGKGRDLRNPVITYKGQAVPAASWPGAVGLWRSVATAPIGRRYTTALTKGARHGSLTAPHDMVAPVYAWALLQRPRVRVAEVQA